MDDISFWCPTSSSSLSNEQMSGSTNEQNLNLNPTQPIQYNDNLTMINGLNCHICSRIFYSSLSLEHHMRTHDSRRTYPCTVCSYRALTNAHLKTHMVTHTRDKSHKCPYCFFKTGFKSNLDRHVKTMHMNLVRQMGQNQ